MKNFEVITNDYQFLFRFVLETDALIEPLDFDDLCNRFRLWYANESLFLTAKDLMDSFFVEG